MKKLLHAVTPLIALAASITLLAPAHTHAATASAAECSVTVIGATNTAGKADSRFSFKNNNRSVSATFEVRGDDTCVADVVLASWQAPNGDEGRPYEVQKLYKHSEGSFRKGRHTLTVELPSCHYQVDLARGKNPTGPNGKAVYESGRLMGSLHGGTKACAGLTAPAAAHTMPETGTGNLVGLFAATTAFGAVAHRLFSNRRLR